MMTIRTTVLILFAFLLPAAVAGQKTDFGIWYEAKAEKKIIGNLRLDLETSIRTDRNAAHIDKYYIEPGIRYKFNDYLAAGLYYRLIKQNEDDGNYHVRHRWFLQVKGTAPELYRFTFALRSRIQQQIKTYIEDPHDEVPGWYHRLRFELDYDIRGLPLKPYVNVEMHTMLFSPNEYTADKWRSMIGAEYTFNKRHTFGLEYIYNDSRVTKPAYENILGVTYSVKL
jgi:predicted porin